MAQKPNYHRIWLALVYTRKIAMLYAMLNFFLFVFSVVIKFYNAFAIHNAIGKQVSLTRILLSGVFGIFTITLTQLIAEAQETDNSSDDDDNTSHHTSDNNTTKKKKTKRQKATSTTK